MKIMNSSNSVSQSCALTSNTLAWRCYNADCDSATPAPHESWTNLNDAEMLVQPKATNPAMCFDAERIKLTDTAGRTTINSAMKTNDSNNQDSTSSEPAKPRSLQRVVRRWVWEQILTLFRRHLYRHVMRVAHRYNWHYAPPRGLMEGEKYDGHKHHWCQWCGLRGDTLDYEHFKDAPLSPND